MEDCGERGVARWKAGNEGGDGRGLYRVDAGDDHKDEEGRCDREEGGKESADDALKSVEVAKETHDAEDAEEAEERERGDGLEEKRDEADGDLRSQTR